MVVELIPGRGYYGQHGTGWVVLVNGQPHHETTKRGAMQFIALLPTPQEIHSMKTMTMTQAQRRYDAMEPPDDGPDLTEMPTEELEMWLAMAEGAAEDPDVPARARHKCDEACLQLQWEISRRRREEDRT
jgi:hypothetical protein